MARREKDLSWMDKVKSSKDKSLDHLSAILFGPYGSGKTKFASTWPKPFFIAAEDGMLTVRNDDIPYVLIDPDKAVYSTIIDIFAVASQKQGPFAEVQTLVIDSMSKLNRMMLDEILEERGTDKAEYDEWKRLRTNMNRINNLFVRLPYNRLVTVGEAYKEDKYMKELKPDFNIEGGFRADLAGEYDNVWCFQKKVVGRNQKFIMNTEDFRGRQAKKRLVLPSEIENPTYKKIMENIK